MQMRISLLIATAMVATIASGPAHACSLGSDYRSPTMLELVDRADAIVLARVEEGGPSEVAGARSAKLIPFAVLKGSALPTEIGFDDALIANDQFTAVASDPRNLVDANPGAFDGNCNRYAFNEGMILVAFLRKRGDKLVADRSPFARTLEDVPSPEALWVKTVNTYVRIAALPKAFRRKEMERLRAQLSLDIDDPDSRLIALELDRALRERRR